MSTAITKQKVQDKVAKILLHLDDNEFDLDDQMQQLYAMQQAAATHIADNQLTCELQTLTCAYVAIKNIKEKDLRDSAEPVNADADNSPAKDSPDKKIEAIKEFTISAVKAARDDKEMTKLELGRFYNSSKKFTPSQKPRDFIAGCLHAINEIACGPGNEKEFKKNLKIITSEIQKFRGANKYTQGLLESLDDNSELSMKPSSHSLGNNGQKGSMKEENGNKLTPNVYDITFKNENAKITHVTRSANLVHPDLKIKDQKAFFKSSVNTIVAKTADKDTNTDVNSGDSETKPLIENEKPFLVYQTLVDPNVALGKDNEAILTRRKRRFASEMKDTDVICTNYSINQNGQPRGVFQSGFSFLINLTTTVPLQQLGDIFGKNGSSFRNLLNPAVWFPQISNDISNLNAQNTIIKRAVSLKENNSDLFSVRSQKTGTSTKNMDYLDLYKRERTKMVVRSVFSSLPIIGFMAQIGTHNLRTAALETILVGRMAGKDPRVFFNSSCKSGKDRESVVWASALALLEDPTLKGESLLDATCEKYFELRDNARVIAGVSEGTVANKVLEEAFGIDRIKKYCSEYNSKEQTSNAQCNKFTKKPSYQVGENNGFLNQIDRKATKYVDIDATESFMNELENSAKKAEDITSKERISITTKGPSMQ